MLVGTSGASGISIGSAVNAAITGVRRANRRIRDLGLRARVRSLSIYELFEDRAIDAVTAAAKLRSTDGDEDEELVIHDLLEDGVDARSGTPRSGHLADRWRTIRVSKMLGDPRPDSARPVQGLTFTEVGRGAGAAMRISEAQLSNIQALVDRGVNDPVVEDQVYNTLYELLVPRSMKGQGRTSENIMYLLDDVAADLPWEMLATRSFDDGVVPLSVEVGMVRRLETGQLREQVRPSSARKALVIGAPYAGPDLPPLPGAIDEARLVADRLEASGWEVNRLISSDSDDRRIDAETVLNGLFAHEYRIVHMAGHGQEPTDMTTGGLVIGEGRFLTAIEFEALQTTPDLVFLNCCHSGSAIGRPDRLASSVGRKLIDIGVRGVVAAGWRVDDEAAYDFADSFYGQMLTGDHLGSAVLAARREVWQSDRGRRTNTWGAYQVYGEPAFQMERDRTTTVAVTLRSRRTFLERVQELDDVAASASGNEIEDIVDRLNELQAQGESHGWMRGEEHQAVGEVFRALGKYEEAAKSYERALGAGGSTATLAIVAQLVSTHGHLGALHAGELDPDCGTDHFQAADKLLEFWEQLLAPPPPLPGLPSNERSTATESEAELLRGKANLLQYRLYVTLPDVGQGRVLIEQALDAFRQAEKAYAEVQRAHPGRPSSQALQYVCLSAVALEWLLLVYQGETKSRAGKKQIAQMVAKVREKRDIATGGVWSMAPFERLRVPDADLLLYLLHDDPTMDQVKDGYLRVFREGASNRERKVIARYVEFLASCLPSEPDFAQKTDDLKSISAVIESG